jgi:nicotinate-nucleotide adenylyltransferase
MSEASGDGNRIAYFGGSFDPPHEGHLAVARAAREALRLDRVLFAPVGLQPLKPGGSSASFAQRVEMTRLAIARDRGFELSLADAPSPTLEPNYTIDTLRRLHAELPGGTELFLILGADAFRQLREWRDAAEIPFAASLIVVSRPGEDLTGIASSVPAALSCERVRASATMQEYRLSDEGGRRAALYVLPELQMDVSATQLREEIHSRAEAEGQAGREARIPMAVLEYIRWHCLYREGPCEG